MSLSTSDSINNGAAITLLLSFHLSTALSITLFSEISQFVCNESLHHGLPCLSLSIFTPVIPSYPTSPLFLASIALFSQFFIGYYLFSRLVLPQSKHRSILSHMSLIPSSQHPFLPSLSFVFFLFHTLFLTFSSK